METTGDTLGHDQESLFGLRWGTCHRPPFRQIILICETDTAGH